MYMAKNPNKWIRNRRKNLDDPGKQEPLSEEQIDALENFVINYQKKPRSAYDKLGSLKKIMTRCVPEGESLLDPTDSLINELPYRIAEETSTPDTERSWRKDLRAFLRDYQKGEYSEKRDIFEVTPTQGDTKEVEPWMIYPLETWKEIADCATYSRTSAFISLMFNTGATPGELLQAKLEDVDLKEGEIEIRGNKNHLDGKYALRPFARNHLTDYLRTHPAVSDLVDLNYDKPLWIKYQRNHCKKCGKLPRNCGDESECDDFVPEDIEPLKYSGFYKQWGKAVEKADIELKHQEKGIKPKYARKSCLTEAVKNGIDERLEKFARWKPGSGQKKAYVNLDKAEVVEWMSQTFDGVSVEQEEEQTDQICEVCGVWNPPEANMCRNCRRFLSEESRREVSEAKELIDDIAKYPLESIRIAAESGQQKDSSEV
jgi:integrase